MVVGAAADAAIWKNLSQNIRSIPQVFGVTKNNEKASPFGADREQTPMSLSKFPPATKVGLVNWKFGQQKDGYSNSCCWWKKPYITWNI